MGPYRRRSSSTAWARRSSTPRAHPAKRLLWLGSAFLLLFLVVNALAFLKPMRGVVDRLQNLMGWPVIILGTVCLFFWFLGAWFRKIANQSADFCERVVEAQFATHTKSLKSRRRDDDARFLAERVIDPELLLRAADDRPAEEPASDGSDELEQDSQSWFENRELAFLRNVRLLYQDYLDGSPLHRSDTKASVQLLGNLALGNLRRSHLGHLLREGRTIDRLDLSRSGGLFGGPYLWFNYITRMLVQETALLILDYNRHAVPVDRLACSPGLVRRRFQNWLAERLRIDPVGSMAARADDTRKRTRGHASVGVGGRNERRGSARPVSRRSIAQRSRVPFSKRSNSRRSTFWPMTPSAWPRSTRGSARRSPSSCAAIASKTSAGHFAAFPCTSCRLKRVRSTPTRFTKSTWPAAGSLSCRFTLVASAPAGCDLGVQSVVPRRPRDPPSSG